MIEELITAREQLSIALDRYIDACSAIQNSCVWKTTASKDSPPVKSLVDCAIKELQLFESFRKKLKIAHAAMRAARNCSAALAPIHNLPTEILCRVFLFVLNTQACLGQAISTYTWRNKRVNLSPVYPDILSFVCYRWRQIIIGSGTIWSHIDLAPHHELLLRAKLHAARAGQLFLDLHIAGSKHYSRFDKTDLARFLGSIAARTRSLRIVALDLPTDFYIPLVRSCFVFCTPGILTRVSIESARATGPYFIHTQVSPQDIGTLSLDVPQDHLKSIWLSINSLNLIGIYPWWTSQAYHGLIELRLLLEGTRPEPSISELQLVRVLRASPGLRVFYFNLNLTDTLPRHRPVTTVHLNDLEVLKAELWEYSQLEVLLRWFAPSRVPLHLSMNIPSSSSAWTIHDPGDEVGRFLGRFEVSTLCLGGVNAYLTQAIDLIRLTRGLRVLAIRDFLGKPVPAPYLL